MVRALLVRGMLAGALAGLLAFAFAWLFGEPQVNLAIGFEEHMRQMAGEAPEPEGYARRESFYPLSSRVFGRSVLRLPIKVAEHPLGLAQLRRIRAVFPSELL